MTVYNTDGSVYMTTNMVGTAPGNLEGWMVRQVTSTSHKGECCERTQFRGTWALTTSDVDSKRGLNRLVWELAQDYGYRPVSTRVAYDTYRWTFESRSDCGHRVTDMVIASKIH